MSLEQLFAQKEQADKMMTMRGEEMQPTRTESALTNIAARVAGTPIDVGSAVAEFLGVGKAPEVSATESIRKGLEEAQGISGTEKGDVVTQFLVGAGEAAPYAVAAAGPSAVTPIGALGVGATLTGAGLYNVFIESDFYDEYPLISLGAEVISLGAPMIAGSKTRVARAGDGFDPELPLTTGERGVGTGDQKTQLAREAKTATQPVGVESETQRSQVIQQKLARDLNVVEIDPNLTWNQAANEIRAKVISRSKALTRKLNFEQDKKIAEIPETKIPTAPFADALTNPKFKTRGQLLEPEQAKAVDLYAERIGIFRDVNPRSLHEEMKRIGEIAFDKLPFEETAFYKTLAKKPETAELAKILNQMPTSSREAWAKHVYASYNRGLTDVAKSDVIGGVSAKKLLEFKALANQQIQMKKKLFNQPLYSFFGDDFDKMSASDLATALNKSNPDAVKTLSASLRKTNPEAFDKLRETVFHDWLKSYKTRGADGQAMFDWEMLADPDNLKALTKNEFLKTGIDGRAFGETIKALAKINRRFDPDVMAQPAMSQARADRMIQSGLKVARAGYYDSAVATEGAIGIIKAAMFSNPKNLSLFNPMELQLMTKVLNGQKLNQKNMEKLYSSLNAKSRVLFAVPTTILGGRTARASAQEVAPITDDQRQRTGLEGLFAEKERQDRASTPQATESIPVSP